MVKLEQFYNLNKLSQRLLNLIDYVILLIPIKLDKFSCDKN